MKFDSQLKTINMKKILLILSLVLIVSQAKSQIIITGFMADSKGPDNNNEYMQFMATEDIDFSETSFSVVTCTNAGSVPPSAGWATGEGRTYKFNLEAGVVVKGSFFYVGGNNKLINGSGSTDIKSANWIKAVDYTKVAGDDFGNVTTGLLPNSGNAGGIAVFKGTTVTETSTPIDAVFYGGNGTASIIDVVNNKGYRVPIPANDYYNSVNAGVNPAEEQPFFSQGTNQFRFPHLDKARYDGGQGAFAKLKGEYNTVTKTWVTKRTLVYEDVAPNAALISLETGNIVVLPIDLITFTANSQATTVNLNWSTASETDNSHFDITRSVDGKVFDVIGTEKGNGTTKSVSNYRFTDSSPVLGTNYYQLRQVDFNGKSSLSKIEAVKFSLNTRRFSAYAPRDKSEVKFSVYTEKGEDVKIVITNMKGEEISKSSFKLIKGINSFNLPVQLSSGVYVTRLFSKEGNLSAKFMKE